VQIIAGVQDTGDGWGVGYGRGAGDESGCWS